MASPKTSTKTAAKAPTIDSQAGSGKGFMLLIIGILVVGLAGVAYFVTSREAAPSGDAEAAVTIDGDPIATFPLESGISADPAVDPAIGATFPTISGTDFSGNDVTIADDGRPKAVYYLAHWCPHCQAELPKLVSMSEAGLIPDGVDLYAVSTDYRPDAGNPAGRWFYNEGWTFPIVRDDAGSPAFAGSGGRGFPYAVYVDADNTIVARSSGETAEDAILGLWEQLAAGQPEGQ